MPRGREDLRMDTNETEREIKVDVSYLGRVGEGEGAITSTLEEDRFGEVAEGLRQSIARVEQDGCTACIDGRCTLHLANSAKGKVRPRKAGASVSPFSMMAIGDPDYLESLRSRVTSPEDFYKEISDLQRHFGRRESGHAGLGPDGELVFDCGAAGGLVEQVGAVGQLELDGPIASLVIDFLASHGVGQGEAEEMVSGNIERARSFSEVLAENNWDGKKYVAKVASDDPEAVEVLEYDSQDPLHGHKEQFVALVDGPMDEDGPLYSVDKDEMKKHTGLEGFVVNVDELRRDAAQGSSNEKEEAKLLAASLLYHLGGVYKKLGDGSHPVFYIKVEK